MTDPTGSSSTAADLCGRYLAGLADRDVDAIAALLAEDSVSEFPFSPFASKRIVRGVPAEAEFLGYILGLLEHIEIRELEIIAVTRDLAFAEFASDCVTRGGGSYQNRYIVKVDSEAGRITRWREYLDPKAIETVK